MSSLTKSPRASLRLETLEDRLALSWAGVPPSVVTISSATSITLNSNRSATGSAAITNNEVDYYSFTAPVSGSYRFSALTPTSNLDPVLGVFSSTGQRMAYNDDISSGNTDSRVFVNLTAGRRYYFGITNYTGSPRGAYTWQVAGPATIVSDDAYENNDSMALASNLGGLTARRTINGLVMADTADWFRFSMSGTGTSSDYVSISFTHSRGDLDLRLFNAAGNLIRYSDGVGNSERVSLDRLPGGTYFVQIYGYRGVFNPSYSLDIDPATGGGPTPSSKVLYLNFDGANISRSDLVRWAGSDWASMVNLFDADNNGITVGRFLPDRADREQIISRMMQLIQADLQPFGIEVRRHNGLAVEGVGATTIFLGDSTLSNGFAHVACSIDIGNNDRTDIAFVANEDWGSVERTALAMADVTLHEAGHTWGLWHVNSGTAAESMGLRYSVNDQNQWVQNTAFLNRTFAAYVDSNGFPHGSGPQNSFQTMTNVFGTSTTSNASASIDTSRAGVFTITTSSPGIDRITVRRLPSGNIEVMVNGKAYELVRGYRQVIVHTSGDTRDQVRVLNNLASVHISVNRQAGAEIRSIAKGESRQATLWATGQQPDNSHNFGCGCPLCQGGLLTARNFINSATQAL